MKKITSSGLARMLNDGFEGNVDFSGRIFMKLRTDKKDHPSLDDKSPPTFYQAGGQFSLTPAGRDQRVEDGSYAITNNESVFYFKPKEGERIESHNQEGYGDVIALDIDFPTNAVLQIEPRDIMY